MINISVSKYNIRPAVIKQIAGSLKKGCLVVLPTDTIYGLSCLATDARAIKHLKSLKGRDPKKPFLILVNDLALLKKYAFLSPRQAVWLKRYWSPCSRPTTVILKNRGILPKELTGQADGLAIRLPKSKFLIKIIKAVGVPLVSTSLNISGQKNINDPKSIKRYLSGQEKNISLVVSAGKSQSARPSRLVDLRTREPLVIRK